MEISREDTLFPYIFFYKFQLRKSFTTSQSNSGGNSNFQSAMPIVPKKIHPVVIIFFLSALCPIAISFVPRGNIFDPFSIDIWNPLEAFTSIFDSALAVPRSNYPAEPAVFVSTRMDWKETPEAHIFKADLPGLKKEEVRVEVEGHVLQISGERKREQEEKTDRWHSVERSCGKFVRRFRLPENVKVDQVKASMENGVLTVFVPKEDVKKHEVKSIEISGDEL